MIHEGKKKPNLLLSFYENKRIVGRLLGGEGMILMIDLNQLSFNQLIYPHYFYFSG